MATILKEVWHISSVRLKGRLDLRSLITAVLHFETRQIPPFGGEIFGARGSDVLRIFDRFLECLRDAITQGTRERLGTTMMHRVACGKRDETSNVALSIYERKGM